MALLKYSVLRLALLAVVAVALYLAGLRDLPLVVAARRAARGAGGARFSRSIEDAAAAEDATVDGADARATHLADRGSDGEPERE